MGLSVLVSAVELKQDCPSLTIPNGLTSCQRFQIESDTVAIFFVDLKYGRIK
jgi:hypothetical protein